MAVMSVAGKIYVIALVGLSPYSSRSKHLFLTLYSGGVSCDKRGLDSGSHVSHKKDFSCIYLSI